MEKSLAVSIVSALAVVGSAMAEFTCKIDVPAGDIGKSRTATLTYGNTGSSAIDAPYVRVVAGDGAYVRFAATDAWTKSVEFLATSSQSPASSLRAGETVTQTIFVATVTEEAQLELSYAQSSSEAFPWSTIGSSLKPSYVADSAWSFALATLKSRFGTTWNSYLNRLRSDADYLAENGRPVRRLDSLLQIEVNRALGVDAVLPVLASVTDAARSARGLGLSFTRSYSSAMYGRFTSGILGYGWTDNLSTYAELSSDGKTLVFRVPGGGSYSFTKATGSWRPEDARDKTVLTESSSAYTLTYQSGTVQAFAKSNMRTSSIADNCGNTLTFTWSGTTLQKITHTDGQSLAFAYSGGLLSSVTDDCGRKTQYTYSNSLLTKVTAPDGLATSYEYRSADGTAAARALSRIVYPDGTTREFAYDTSSGLVSAISVNGGKEKTTISRNDLAVTLTGPDGAETTVKMGVSGEALETVDALGGVSADGYTDDGLLKSIVSPSGLTGSIAHDSLGRVSKSVSASGTATAFSYEETFGNLKTVTDAKSHAVTYGYDSKGRSTSVTFADGSASTIEYDNSNGDVKKSTNRRGQSISYEYDYKGRLTKKTWSNGRTFTYEYDSHGNVTTASDSETGAVSMEYDPVADRLAKITYPKGRGFSFTYDAAGRLAARTSFDGAVERFTYDASGRLASVMDGNGNIYLRNTYDEATGRLSKQVNGNGTSVSCLYDKLGRVVSIEHRDANGKIAESLQYCYDADGRCIRAASLLGEERYTYDKDGQLTAVDYPNDADETFAYDSVGNRTTANGATYTVNNLNQYTEISDGTSLTYDKDGNLTKMTGGNGTTFYYYDMLNRLVAVTNTTTGTRWSCQYDVFGNRVSVTDNGVTTERIYLQGPLPSVAAEYINGELTARHIVVGAVNLATLSTHNSQYSTQYYHADLIGSTRLITDDSGVVVDRRAYKAFGETRVGEDTDSSTGYVGTLGVETDSTGLLFMRNRYYSSTLGRFIQMDPIGLHGEDVNLYRYCGNSSMSLVDVTGYSSWDKHDENTYANEKMLATIFLDGLSHTKLPDVSLWAKTMGVSLTGAVVLGKVFEGKYEDASIEVFKFGVSAISAPVKFVLAQLDILMAQIDDYNEEIGITSLLNWTDTRNVEMHSKMTLSDGKEVCFNGISDKIPCDSIINVDISSAGGSSGVSGDIPTSGEISTDPPANGKGTSTASMTATVSGSFTISFETKMSSYRLLGQAGSCLQFYVDGALKSESPGQSWVQHSFMVSGEGEHRLEWRVIGNYGLVTDLFLEDLPVKGYVRNIEITRPAKAANVVKAASVTSEAGCSIKGEAAADAATTDFLSGNEKSTSPRLYCYERYVVVKGVYYNFALSADGGAAISVSGLPSGFSFSSGRISGSASAVGSATVTIKATSSTGTVTKQVPLVIIDVPDCWNLKQHVSYLITFDDNYSGGFTYQHWFRDDEVITKSNPGARSGYKFLGWYTARSGGTRLTENTKPTQTMTYYAHWAETEFDFGDIEWTLQSDGSWRSGVIDDNGSTYMVKSVSGAGRVSFKWKTSSESNYDKLHFYVNGTEVVPAISGVMDGWASVSYDVPAGRASVGGTTARLKWEYTKDGSDKDGSDCAWVRDVVWTSVSSGGTYVLTLHRNNSVNDGATAGRTLTIDVARALPKIADELKWAPRSGYTFLGWATSASATTAKYTDGQSVQNLSTSQDATAHLYAVWKANSYLLRLHRNNSAADTATAGRTLTIDVARALPKIESELKWAPRSGYTFLGWATSASATSAKYSDGQSVKNLSTAQGATVHLYAVWKKDDATPQFTFGGDASWTKQSDGSWKSGALGDNESAYMSMKVTGPGTISFKWKTSSESNYDKLHFYVNGSEPVAAISGEMGNWASLTYNVTVSGTVTLKWEYQKDVSASAGSDCGWIKDVAWSSTASAKTYIVRLHRNNSERDGATAGRTYTVGKARALPKMQNELKWAPRKGYDFLGWSKSATAATATYTDGQSLKDLTTTAGATVHLYAVWKPHKYIVRLHRNNSVNDGATTGRAFDYDQVRFLPTMAEIKWVRSGYMFLGWSLAQNSSTVKYADGLNVFNLSANDGEELHVWGVWKKAEANAYLLRLHRNNSERDGATAGRQLKLNTSRKLPTVKELGWTRTDATFKGWATTAKNAAAGKVAYKDGATVTNLVKTQGDTAHIYAVWQ